MKDIEVIGMWGDKQKTIRITPVSGQGNVYHIYIDKWYHGNFVKVNKKWVIFLGSKSDLCSNDILVLKELIENNSGK